jgi:hypothetical protein
MVLTVEPCPVPSLTGSLHRKVKEAITKAGLETNAPNNLGVSGTRLVLQEKVILEQRKVRMNDEKWFVEMDKDDNLKNGIGIEMD